MLEVVVIGVGVASGGGGPESATDCLCLLPKEIGGLVKRRKIYLPDNEHSNANVSAHSSHTDPHRLQLLL